MLDRAAQEEAVSTEGLSGIRLNLGRIEGGEKPNMIAAECRVRFGVRPRPGTEPSALLRDLAALTGRPERVRFEPGFLGPTLPAGQVERGSTEQLERGRALAQRLGLDEGAAVDFWTEASLFSEAGYAALVYGPGDISQAHTADEWVLLSDLEEAAGTYARILSGESP